MNATVDPAARRAPEAPAADVIAVRQLSLTYGGSVTLAEDPQLSQLKEGEVYKIDGRLQNPESHFSAPTYVVKDVKSQER